MGKIAKLAPIFWRIVFPKFINLMQDLIKDCVQYLDVEIRSQEINYYDCKIMHVTKSLEALDYEHSIYTYMGDNDEYLSITKAVLKKNQNLMEVIYLELKMMKYLFLYQMNLEKE